MRVLTAIVLSPFWLLGYVVGHVAAAMARGTEAAGKLWGYDP